MKRSEPSQGDICRQPISDLKEEPEDIFSSALITPLLAAVSYLVFIKTQHDEFKKIENEDRPFQGAWWSGPVFFSIFYLTVVYFGPKYMEKREPYHIKPYMFTYNLYQCLINLWGFVEM